MKELPETKNTLKIEYRPKDPTSITGAGVAIVFGVFLFLCVPAFLLQIMYKYGGMAWINYYLYPTIIFFGLGLIAYSITSFCLLRSDAHKDQNSRENIRKNWKHVTGKIIHVNSDFVGVGRSHEIVYYYEIEYKHPDTHKKCTFRTPYLIDYPGIKDVDLPLAVELYLSKKKIFADEIINPPYGKMKSRAKLITVISILFTVGLLGTFFLFSYGHPILAIITAVCTIALVVGLSSRYYKEVKE